MSDGPERTTPRVRRVLAAAEAEALDLRQSEVGPEHLLLALLRETRGLATRALADLGVDPVGLAQRFRARLVPGEIAGVPPLALGPGARSAVEMSRAEAARLHHAYLGTEHLLLGLLRDGEGPAYVALVGAGITLDRARRQISRLINESAPEPPGGLDAGLAAARDRALPTIDRYRETGTPDAPRDGPDLCPRCGRVRRAEWRFCAFCGEKRPACDRCDTAIPQLSGVRFCAGCGAMLSLDERV